VNMSGERVSKQGGGQRWDEVNHGKFCFQGWSGGYNRHQLMSTCPMAALVPPRDPTDTNTWSGGDNRPSTNVYFPNGHISPPRDPTDTNTWSGGDNRPSTDVYLPNGRIRPSRNPTDTNTWSGVTIGIN